MKLLRIAAACCTPLLCCLANAQSARNIVIHVAARVGDQPFSCSATYDGVGVSHTRIKPRDLRFFFSQVEFLTADGRAVPLVLTQDGIWQYKNLALMDFEDGTGSCINGNAGINQQIVGTVPAGSYVGLRVTLGVPFELDHINTITAPSPLNTTAMLWSWQDGFKFLRAEIAVVSPRTTQGAQRPPSGFPIHVGSTACPSPESPTASPKECAHPNRVTITFPHFDPDHDQLVFDLAALLAGVNLDAPPAGTGPGCMSFPGTPACAAPMRALGLPYDNAPAVEQTVFHREPRR